MLLDPLEEQFHLPARLVEQADGEGWQVEIVGEEPQKTILFGIVKVNPAEWVRVMLPGGGGSQDNGVIGSKSGGGVDVARVAPAELDTFLGASDEECATLMEDMQTLEVHVSAIQHIERTRFRDDGIEDVDVV